MKTIELTRGYVTVVDDEDYDFLMQWEWRAHGANPYAARSLHIFRGLKRTVFMHDQLMGFAPVDHVNLNRLDNRKRNLRPATPTGNNANVSKYKKNATSKYKGVCQRKGERKWLAQIQANDKKHRLGLFE